MVIQQEAKPNKATNANENPINERKLSRLYICSSIKTVLDALKATKIVNVTPQKSVPLGKSMGPKPVQPEPQIQPYEIVQRSGQIKKCNGCEELFDKNNEKLLILGRSEFDWYILVDEKNNTKV